MWFWSLCSLFLFTVNTKINAQTHVKSVKFIKAWTLPGTLKIGSQRVGGLSGCALKNDKIYFVTDDRGGEGGARFISFPWDSKKNEINFKSGKNTKIQNLNSKKILDLEGIAFNSQNEILLSNEGDLNKKPRQPPELFWVNMSGKRLRNIQLPNSYLPNLVGQQSQGVQNNMGFEGLSTDLNLKRWGAFLEGPKISGLNQAEDHLDYIESDMTSNKVEQEFKYPLPDFEGSAMVMAMGATDFLFTSAQELLVLERGVELSLQGITFKVQLCTAVKDKKQLIRICKYQFNADQPLLKSIQKVANFEGLCWLNEKKTQFLVVSDNNFSKSENTVFLLYNLN
jgi:hypothetical protein